MRCEVGLSGALGAMEPQGIVHLVIPDGACAEDPRRILDAHALLDWTRHQPGMLHRCAFAGETVLCDGEPVPGHGRIVAPMPVSGG